MAPNRQRAKRAARTCGVRLGVVLLLVASGSGIALAAASKPPPPSTLAALLRQPGENVQMALGTSDYQPGLVRLSFLVIRGNGQAVLRPTARVWVAVGLQTRLLVQTAAASERIGVPNGHFHYPDLLRLYVSHFRVAEPGKYYVVAEATGESRVRSVGQLLVKRLTDSPPVGSKAIPSQTPTIASVHGDYAKVTTRVPPDKELVRYSVAESLKAHKPFVLAFATPKFCISRTCGPVVDVEDAVRQQFQGRGIRFIHVEVYEDNNPAKGYNRWMREWHLPTEPWTFLVVILVEAHAGDGIGLGWTYGAPATAKLIKEELAPAGATSNARAPDASAATSPA